MGARVSVRQKQHVRERAGGYCEYCLIPENFSPQAHSIEHFWPQSKEGSTDLENLVLSYQGCNNHKYNKTGGIDPLTGETAPLFNPRTQFWPDHFAWNEDFTRIEGLTATGRATIEILRLNRRGVINIRRALFMLGQHPREIK